MPLQTVPLSVLDILRGIPDTTFNVLMRDAAGLDSSPNRRERNGPSERKTTYSVRSILWER